jgi:hypothetical protein
LIQYELPALGKYNPAKPYYIGTIAERVDYIINNHAPMASTIATLPCLEKNEDDAYALEADQGDRLLYNCIHKKTDVSLTYLPRLNQEDEFGDPSGLYESGRKLLSMHHFKSWHHTEPAKIHTVADACSEDCILQRFQFRDYFILTNGYSVAHYL